jgi:hypothetical protein
MMMTKAHQVNFYKVSLGKIIVVEAKKKNYFDLKSDPGKHLDDLSPPGKFYKG